MSQHLKAVYEHGVFRPLQPVQLEEHQEVTLVLETADAEARMVEEKPIWEFAAELVRELPEEVLDRVPTAGAAEHDHYLYAANKRD